MLRTNNQLWGGLSGAAIVLMIAQPAGAESVQVVEVELQQGEGEFRLVLITSGGDEPLQVQTREQGNSLIADIPESQLRVEGNSMGFRTTNPIPGIAVVELAPTSANSLRLTVTGDDNLPMGRIQRHTSERIVFEFTPAPAPLPLSAAVDVPPYPELWGASAQIRQTFQLHQAIAPHLVAELVQQGAAAPGGEFLSDSAVLPLDGLSVTSDHQANTISLLGEASQVYAAARLLKRVDVRLPLMAVNIKVMTVDFQNFRRTAVCPWEGIDAPPPFGWPDVIDLSHPELALPDSLGETLSCAVYDPGNFIAHLQAALESNNAQVLNDVTLLAQSGQTATVQLRQNMMPQVEAAQTIAEDEANITVNTENTGLSLAIDANFRENNQGLVNLDIRSTVMPPLNSAPLDGQLPRNQRQVSSGQRQMREGQTLIVTGIIQAQETFLWEEHPELLQDNPSLRSLFGRSSDPHQQQKIIILITPIALHAP